MKSPRQNGGFFIRLRATLAVMQQDDDFDVRGEAEQASDGDLDRVLRPARFEDFTGQRAAMDNLQVLVLAAKQVAEPDQPDQTPSAPGGLGAPLSKDALLGMALADADRVIAMEGTWPKGHSRRGNALHVMGRFTEARTSYEEALRLDPTNSQVISSLKDVEKEIEKQAPQNGAA